jgi:hypothetical protein
MTSIKKGRQTKITLKTKICERCEGSEASTEETYQFNENSNLRGEIDGNLTNNNQKELKSLHSVHAFTPITDTYRDMYVRVRDLYWWYDLLCLQGVSLS